MNAVRDPAGEAVVSVRGLVNEFGDNRVHDGLDLDVRRGEILGVVGGSGSGKSVLMRTILGLQKPTSGTVRIEGRDITAMSSRELLEIKRGYGVAFQRGALFSSLTVAENIGMPITEFYSIPHRTLDEIVTLRVGMVGLPGDAARLYPAELSGGMTKRVALARALALDPRLLFLDEPTAGLDPISAAGFDELILHLQQNLGLTVVMITHDLDSLVSVCNRIAVLVDKKILVGTYEELLQHEHPWIREYFHGPRGRSVRTENRHG